MIVDRSFQHKVAGVCYRELCVVERQIGKLSRANDIESSGSRSPQGSACDVKRIAERNGRSVLGLNQAARVSDRTANIQVAADCPHDSFVDRAKSIGCVNRQRSCRFNDRILIEPKTNRIGANVTLASNRLLFKGQDCATGTADLGARAHRDQTVACIEVTGVDRGVTVDNSDLPAVIKIDRR